MVTWQHVSREEKDGVPLYTEDLFIGNDGMYHFRLNKKAVTPKGETPYLAVTFALFNAEEPDESVQIEYYLDINGEIGQRSTIFDFPDFQNRCGHILASRWELRPLLEARVDP